jgi:predicted amidohydrolase YtcJ
MIKADFIIGHGRIITMEPGDDGTYSFVAIGGDRILCVGRKEELPDWVSPGTEIIDAHGGTILPGFIDAHLHLSIMAEMATQLDVSPGVVTSSKDLKGIIREEARRHPEGEWIRAAGYDDTKVSGKPVDRWDLDEVAPRHPVYVNHVSVHWGVANSLGLERGGLDVNSPDPPGGRLGRDPATHRLNGILYEEAGFRYSLEALSADPETVIPPCSREDLRRGILSVGDRYLRAGLTSVQDALATPRFFEECQYLRREGVMPLRVCGFIPYKYFNLFLQTGLRTGFGDEWLNIGAVKLIVDGAIAGRTACMTEPYGPEELGTGILLLTPGEIRDHVMKAHQAGFQVAVHANGDRAIELVLDAFEGALRAFPASGRRHRIEHCSLITEDILQRMSRLGLVAVPFGSYVWAHGEKFLTFYGEERVGRLFAHRSFLDHGIALAGSTDNPCGPYEPLAAIQSCVTRKGQDGALLGENQRITLQEALRMYTLGSAYASHEEHRKGSLAPGKLADVVILGEDITQAPPESIADIPVTLTMVGGRVRSRGTQ